ncbi:MAG: NADPH-dependent FMN reductase [Novosphingobium sp.]
MTDVNIVTLVGSLRQDSFNRLVARALKSLAPAEFSFTDAEIGDLPLYNQDDDAAQAPQVLRLKDQISKAQGVLVVTPEYNRSIPGVLKNAIDHCSRPPGKGVWGGKPAGIIGVSPGTTGTAMAQQHLRNVFSSLDVSVMRVPEGYLRATDDMFGADGLPRGDGAKFLQLWMDDYAAWIRAHLKS